MVLEKQEGARRSERQGKRSFPGARKGRRARIELASRAVCKTGLLSLESSSVFPQAPMLTTTPSAPSLQKLELPLLLAKIKTEFALTKGFSGTVMK